MQAIRVRKRAKTGGYTVHWLLDPGRTYCGRHVADLQVDEQLELETLPTLEGCRGCERFADGWEKPPSAPGLYGGGGVTATPAPGRMRSTGPAYQGPRSRLGGRRAG